MHIVRLWLPKRCLLVTTGVEPATFRLRVRRPTTAPPRQTTSTSSTTGFLMGSLFVQYCCCGCVGVTDESSMRGSSDHQKRSVSAELHADVSVRHELVVPVVSRRSDLLRTPLTSTRTHAVTSLYYSKNVAVAEIADRTALSACQE